MTKEMVFAGVEPTTKWVSKLIYTVYYYFLLKTTLLLPFASQVLLSRVPRLL